MPARAFATERQMFIGGTLGYSYIDEHYQWFSGLGATGEFRYGLNDAIDLEVDASAYGYPTGHQLVPATSAGLIYVLDTMHIIPQVGATIGVNDIWTVTCSQKGDRPCGHEAHPSLSIPAAIDLRVTSHLSLGAHFRYTFLVPLHRKSGWGPLLSQITIGAAIEFSTPQ